MRPPPAWELCFDDARRDPAALDLRWRSYSESRHEALSAEREARGDGFWSGVLSSEHGVVLLPSLPHLDELWTLYCVVAEARGNSTREWQAMTRYVVDARQGFWTDRVSPELSVQAVYLAIAQHHLADGRRDERGFLDSAFLLLDGVVACLERGDSIADTPWIANEPALRRYVAMLEQDLEVYTTRDRPRAKVWVATLPPEHAPRGAARRLSLLALDAPVSRNVRLWARSDRAAPTGAGFELLLLSVRGLPIALTVDPRTGIQVDWLADVLDPADVAPWYRGERHRGTLIAAPTQSTLTLETIVERLRAPLQLRAPRTKRPMLAIAAIFVALVVVVVGLVQRDVSSSASTPPTTPLDLDARQALRERLRAKSGGELERFALLVGVCRYRESPDRALVSSCDDARALRDALVRDFGYLESNVELMVDDARARDRIPTARNIRLALEGFRERGVREDSSFLLYYSGHGDYRRGARVQYGVLQPAGYFEEGAPEAERGLDMQLLRNEIQKSIRSRHVMVVLDACRSGWGTAGAPPSSHHGVHERWNDPTFVVLAASGQAQLAWSPGDDDPRRWGGLSVFTHSLLRGLGAGTDQLPADEDGDGLVADEELFAFVAQEVPALVRVACGSGERQEPQFRRFAVEGSETQGQFLFVRSR